MKSTQIVVRLDKNNNVINWLENRGYKNIHNLNIDNYLFPVLVVDKVSKCFFGTNTTCMAAMPPEVIAFDKLKTLITC